MTVFSITLFPIILLIGTGFLIKRRQLVSESFWPAADRLSYYLFFPSLLIEKIATMELSAVPVGKLAFCIVFVLGSMTVLLIFLQRLKPVEAATFTSVYQGAIRFNTFMALTIIASNWGEASYAMNVSLLMSGMMIICINLMCLSVFSAYLNKDSSLWHKISIVIKNPLIVSCVIGIVINLSAVDLPAFITATLVLLGKVALPLGLMSVGAGLIIKFNDWFSYGIGLSIIVKLMVMPLLAFISGWLIGLDTVSHQVLVLMFSVPTAVSGYILAGQLGGDIRSMAKIITIQTMVSALTLFFILLWVANLNA